MGQQEMDAQQVVMVVVAAAAVVTEFTVARL